MIFLTIGTHEPFDRLVRAFDAWCAGRGGVPVFGQVTEPRAGSYRPQHFEWVARLDPQDYDGRMRAASLIVSHAGMGSILTALQYAKPIVVMPRRGHLHETRNDHQFTTVRMLRDRPGIHVADDETQLGPVLDSLLPDRLRDGLAADLAPPPIPALADPAFTDALRAFLIGHPFDRK